MKWVRSKLRKLNRIVTAFKKAIAKALLINGALVTVAQLSPLNDWILDMIEYMGVTLPPSATTYLLAIQFATLCIIEIAAWLLPKFIRKYRPTVALTSYVSREFRAEVDAHWERQRPKYKSRSHNIYCVLHDELQRAKPDRAQEGRAAYAHRPPSREYG